MIGKLFVVMLMIPTKMPTAIMKRKMPVRYFSFFLTVIIFFIISPRNIFNVCTEWELAGRLNTFILRL